MVIHNAIMLSTCNLFQRPRHIQQDFSPWQTVAPQNLGRCKASGDCYDCYDCDVFHFNRDVVVSSPGPQAQQEICSSMHEALRREESLGSHTGLCMEATWDFTCNIAGQNLLSGTIHQPHHSWTVQTFHDNSQPFTKQMHYMSHTFKPSHFLR